MDPASHGAQESHRSKQSLCATNTRLVVNDDLLGEGQEHGHLYSYLERSVSVSYLSVRKFVSLVYSLTRGRLLHLAVEIQRTIGRGLLDVH